MVEDGRKPISYVVEQMAAVQQQLQRLCRSIDLSTQQDGKTQNTLELAEFVPCCFQTRRPYDEDVLSEGSCGTNATGMRMNPAEVDIDICNVFSKKVGGL